LTQKIGYEREKEKYGRKRGAVERERWVRRKIQSVGRRDKGKRRNCGEGKKGEEGTKILGEKGNREEKRWW
jgi:hypothetical protein